MPVQTYIATILRGPQMEIEVFHICGPGTDDAIQRLASIAKIERHRVIDIQCEFEPSMSRAA